MSTFIQLSGGSGSGDMLKSVYDPQATGIVLSAHKEMVEVVNKTGSPIPEGSIVYLKTSSSSGTHPEILLADADTEPTSSKTLGAVYETIANNATGYVVTSGEVDNLNTSMYSTGSKLWLSQTAGQVTTTPPVQPAHTVFIGTVTRSQNGNGRILYAIQNGFELHELHDVLISSTPLNNDVLTYESSTALWKNKPASSGGGGGGIHALTQPYTGMAVGLALNTANHNGTTSLSSNVIHLYPFIPASSFTIDQILLPVVTNAASGQATIAIYSDLNGRPNSRLYLSPIIDCSTTGNKILTTSFTFTAGTKYWFSLTQNNGTITFRGISYNWTYQFAWVGNTGSTFGSNCFAYLITTSPGSEPTTLSTGSLSLSFTNTPSYSLRST